jgi:catechol 2,3-dioxygenase-like lactoylglutathione lyase family enzyme
VDALDARVLTSLGRTVLLVRNYDEALAFYRDALGFTVLYDQTASNGQRFLHIGVPGQAGSPPVGLWMLEADGTDAALVGRQAGSHPLFVLYTADCRSTADELARRGVPIRKAPVEDSGAVFAHVADLYGNELVLVQLTEGRGPTGRP